MDLRANAGTGVIALAASANPITTDQKGDYPRALRADAAGTVTFTALDDSTATWTLVAGEWVWMQVKKVTAWSGAANTLHGIY